MKSLLILGRQPQLGLAELESLYGADKVENINNIAAIVDVDPCLLAFDRLGGSIKFCKILTKLSTDRLSDVEEFLIKVSPEQSLKMPSGKMHLGLSCYGFTFQLSAVHKSALKIKKAIQKTGRSVRVVPNKDIKLSSAQIIHNKLTSENGWELVLIKDQTNTIIAQTVKEQDIAAYTNRDRGRPKRDTKVGMLPPKLAQIIINLAAGILPDDARQSVCDIPPETPIPLTALNKTVLDPFCGTGVVLQEALLMGYSAFGSDIDDRLVSYSLDNLDWLKSTFAEIKSSRFRVVKADAANYKWIDLDLVASEAYLGKPYSTAPTETELQENINKCNSIIEKFLLNLSHQTKTGFRLCIAVPAWQTASGVFKQLPLIDQIEDFGYNHIRFETISGDLMYYRPNQVVARQLLVLTRK